MRVPSRDGAGEPRRSPRPPLCAVAVLVHVCAGRRRPPRGAAPRVRPPGWTTPATSPSPTACSAGSTRSGTRGSAATSRGRGDRHRGQRGSAARALRRRARGHDGPARADAARADRALPRRRPQVWTERPPLGADPQVTGPGWVAGPGATEPAPGLRRRGDRRARPRVPRARRARPRPRAPVARIRDQIHRVATSRDWRWPALRLNQINWYSAVFAADAIVNGEHTALADGMGRHLARLPGRRGRERPRPATSAPDCASTTCPAAGCARARTSTPPSTPTSS